MGENFQLVEMSRCVPVQLDEGESEAGGEDWRSSSVFCCDQGFSQRQKFELTGKSWNEVTGLIDVKSTELTQLIHHCSERFSSCVCVRLISWERVRTGKPNAYECFARLRCHSFALKRLWIAMAMASPSWQFAEASTHDYSSALGSRQNIQMTAEILQTSSTHWSLLTYGSFWVCVCIEL